MGRVRTTLPRGPGGLRLADDWIDPPPVGADDALDPRDPYAAPIPPGEYDAEFLSQERRAGMFSNRAEKWLVMLRIVSGAHEGRHLLYACPLMPANQRPRPTFKLAKLWAAVSRGRRLPRDLHRRSPRNLLANAIVRVHVTTVTKDAGGRSQPEALHYSKVEAVVGIVAGTPPAFRNGPT